MVTKCLRALSGLFSPNLIGQSSSKILTAHAKTRPILHDEWSSRLGGGGDRPDMTFKCLAAMLLLIKMFDLLRHFAFQMFGVKLLVISSFCL